MANYLRRLSNILDCNCKTDPPPYVMPTRTGATTNTGAWTATQSQSMRPTASSINGTPTRPTLPLTASIFQQPAHGTVSLNSDGSFVPMHPMLASTARTLRYRQRRLSKAFPLQRMFRRVRLESRLAAAVARGAGRLLDKAASTVSPLSEALGRTGRRSFALRP